MGGSDGSDGRRVHRPLQAFDVHPTDGYHSPPAERSGEVNLFGGVLTLLNTSCFSPVATAAQDLQVLYGGIPASTYRKDVVVLKV
jgi:hypothetical protein